MLNGDDPSVGRTFTTSFLGTGDVTIPKQTSSSALRLAITSVPDRAVTYAPASSSNNNPSYLSGFVGSPLPPSGQQELTGQDLEGTGDGSPGSLYSLEGANGDKLQINFAIPIGPSSQIVLSDVDLAETVTVTAFNGSTPVSLSNWTETAYTGETGALPPSAGTDGWAKWTVTGTNNTTGTLASQQDVQLAGHPVNVLTPGPGQNVTELVFSEVGSGNVEYQVLSPGSTLSAVSGTGTYGGTATLSATLKSVAGNPMDNAPVTFELMEAGTPRPVGSAVTNSNGVATLPGVSLAGFPAGISPGAVMAVFAGDATDSPTTAYGNLTGNHATPDAAINMMNSSGQEADTVLNGGGTFTTSFLGTNDVTIKQTRESFVSADYEFEHNVTAFPREPRRPTTTPATSRASSAAHCRRRGSRNRRGRICKGPATARRAQ